jgi:hypothetical protein
MIIATQTSVVNVAYSSIIEYRVVSLIFLVLLLFECVCCNLTASILRSGKQIFPFMACAYYIEVLLVELR